MLFHFHINHNFGNEMRAGNGREKGNGMKEEAQEMSTSLGPLVFFFFFSFPYFVTNELF